MTENDKSALSALSFFVPSASFEAWLKIATLSRNALETTIDRLSALSLVDLIAGEERYTLHPLTRAFARNELFSNANITLDMDMLFAGYWVDYTQRYGGDYGYKTYDRLDADWTNIVAAANWLWGTANSQDESIGDREAARMFCDLTQNSVNFAWFYGKWDDLVLLRTRSYKVNDVMENWSQAGWSAYNVALVYFNRDNVEETMLWADRCSEAWKRGNSKNDQVVASLLYGLIAEGRENLDEAERVYQEALIAFRDWKDDSQIMSTLHRLASVYWQRKDFETAVMYCQEVLEFSQKLGEKEFQAVSFGSLGDIAVDRNQWEDARKWFELELPLAKEIARLELIAQARSGLACVYEAKGYPDLALDALKIYQRLQTPALASVQEYVENLRRAKDKSN